MPKILSFENVLNVRDFGGHSLDGGKEILPGKLLRGAQISKMSAADKAAFSRHGLQTVIDLRYQAERDRQAPNWDAQFLPLTLTYDDAYSKHKDRKLAPHEIFIIQELKSPTEAMQYMMDSYTQRPKDEGFTNVLSRSLRHMAQTGETVYVHCAAGKDRTGTFAAYVLLMLGLSKDQVIEEYMLTRKAADITPILHAVAQRLEVQYGRPYHPDALRPIFGVETDFIESSLAVIGDPEAYWHDDLGLTGADLTALRRHYTG